MELLASHKESDALKEEIQRLTSMVKQNDSRNLKFQIEDMDNTIRELQDEVKYQRKEDSMQKKWIEVQEEMQNLELHCQCTVLDSKLGESQIVFSGMLKLVEELECKFTSMLEDSALKEKTIDVDLDALLEESRKLDERFTMEENFLTHMYLEKTAEAEEQEKARLYDTELDNLGAEYEVMVQNYAEELAASRANQETLMVNHEKVVVLLEKVKLNEDLKGRVRGLEPELKASELKRLKATEEIFELQVQLQKIEMLQDEIFILKRSLYEAEFEFRRLEASYLMLSLECDELKAKNVSYNRRISTTE
ncbi:hypothetical protein JHK85_011240 [Glycine max]|nr:hypothetical protein JHK85_011240 [Glycine max]KAG5067195.1 hypothetical protein JHK86_010926 [Glycine max]